MVRFCPSPWQVKGGTNILQMCTSSCLTLPKFQVLYGFNPPDENVQLPFSYCLSASPSNRGTSVTQHLQKQNRMPFPSRHFRPPRIPHVRALVDKPTDESPRTSSAVKRLPGDAGPCLWFERNCVAKTLSFREVLGFDTWTTRFSAIFQNAGESAMVD